MGIQGGIQREDSTTLRPNNRYALSKLLCEELTKYEVMYGGLDAVIVRPFMFYHEQEVIGSHRSAMIRFAHDLYHGQIIELSSEKPAKLAAYGRRGRGPGTGDVCQGVHHH